MHCKKQLLQLLSVTMFVMAAVSATAQTQLIKSLKIDNGGSATVVPLWLKTPFSGNAATDSVLTWNPVDFSVRKIPVAALSPQLATKDITAGASVATATNALVITNGAGQVVGANNAALAVNNTAPLWNANQLNGATVSGTPASGQTLTYNGSSWAPATPATPATVNDGTLSLTLNGTTNNSFSANTASNVSLGTIYAPTTAGTSTYLLQSNGSGAPTWVAAPVVNNAALTATINGTASTFTANSNAAVALGTIYAPTTAGTSGQILQSSGSGAPTWTAAPTVNSGTLSLTLNGTTNNTFNANTASNVSLGTIYAPTTAGTSGQILQSSGTGAPTWTAAPTVNNAALTATINGAAQQTFTANSATAVDFGSIYAPTTAGTSGQILQSNGTGAPTWVAAPTGGGGSDASAWKQNGNNWGSATQPGVLGLNSNAANKGLRIQADSVTVGASTDTVNGFTKFQVRGASTNTTAYNAGSGTAIDFTRSNLAYTTASAGAFTITGMKDGGTYTLAVQGTTQGTASFAQTGLTFRPANGNGATLIGYQTVYTFIVMGTTVYFWMTTGI